MTDVCFYFQVHQPNRLRRIQSFRSPEGFDYEDGPRNRAILDRASAKCYLPANEAVLEMIRKTDGWFRVAYSLSGVFLEQLERMRPDVLDSFRALAATGSVEFLDETYYHSLAGLWDDPTEYIAQIGEHRAAMRRLLGQEPTVFRNTELIYDDRIAAVVESLGYEAILTEGTHRILGSRSPGHVYRPSREGARLRVLLKNYGLSDDVAFRFSTRSWPGFPLTAEKYARWLGAASGDTVNLFLDYETFGEHQWRETGIFEFLRALPSAVRREGGLDFALPAEVARRHPVAGGVSAPQAISWADEERDVSAWLENDMQRHCFDELRSLAPLVRETADPALLHAWRLLQTSDHLYYCSTKGMADGGIHAYFSPYDSPYLAFINLKNAISDLRGKAQGLLRR